jgi:predicted hydrocarbon binding protein
VTSDSVHSLIPQSLLEAIRNLDTPLDDGLNELAGETISKRLGLSTTVAQQIERYHELALHNVTVPLDEVIMIFRLIGRRPDAALVYADAGRRAARYTARTSGLGTRLLLRASPRPLRRKLGVRAAAQLARGLLGIELELQQQVPRVRLAESMATRAGFPGAGCYFYSAILAELLRVTSGFEGAMVHERCRARGDDHCTWRAAEAGDYE